MSKNNVQVDPAEAAVARNRILDAVTETLLGTSPSEFRAPAVRAGRALAIMEELRAPEGRLQDEAGAQLGR
jgi:hypothetical protein